MPVNLASLLAAVERMSHAARESQKDNDDDNERELGAATYALMTFDLSALRAAAHQHAEGLREVIQAMNYGGSSNDDPVRAAADFLDGAQE